MPIWWYSLSIGTFLFFLFIPFYFLCLLIPTIRRESLDVANNTIEKIKDKKECEKKAIILCANKYDLSSESVITYKGIILFIILFYILYCFIILTLIVLDGIKLAQLYDIPYVETRLLLIASYILFLSFSFQL